MGLLDAWRGEHLPNCLRKCQSSPWGTHAPRQRRFRNDAETFGLGYIHKLIWNYSTISTFPPDDFSLLKPDFESAAICRGLGQGLWEVSGHFAFCAACPSVCCPQFVFLRKPRLAGQTGCVHTCVSGVPEYQVRLATHTLLFPYWKGLPGFESCRSWFNLISAPLRLPVWSSQKRYDPPCW